MIEKMHGSSFSEKLYFFRNDPPMLHYIKNNNKRLFNLLHKEIHSFMSINSCYNQEYYKVYVQRRHIKFCLWNVIGK